MLTMSWKIGLDSRAVSVSVSDWPGQRCHMWRLSFEPSGLWDINESKQALALLSIFMTFVCVLSTSASLVILHVLCASQLFEIIPLKSFGSHECCNLDENGNKAEIYKNKKKSHALTFTTFLTNTGCLDTFQNFMLSEMCKASLVESVMSFNKACGSLVILHARWRFTWRRVCRLREIAKSESHVKNASAFVFVYE